VPLNTEHSTETDIRILIAFLLNLLKKERLNISVMKMDITNYVKWPNVCSKQPFSISYKLQ
jgi:hypothetical protein